MILRNWAMSCALVLFQAHELLSFIFSGAVLYVCSLFVLKPLQLQIQHCLWKCIFKSLPYFLSLIHWLWMKIYLLLILHDHQFLPQILFYNIPVALLLFLHQLAFLEINYNPWLVKVMEATRCIDSILYLSTMLRW